MSDDFVLMVACLVGLFLMFWSGMIDMVADGVVELADDFLTWLAGDASKRETVYLHEDDAPKRKVVPLLSLMRGQDDPFMDDEEWRWHQWVSDHPEIIQNLHDFCVAMQDALPTAAEANQALIDAFAGHDDGGA